MLMIIEPYHVGDHWWASCTAGHFPIAVVAGGEVLVMAWPVPVG